jgi:glutathione reductase (NADPH)
MEHYDFIALGGGNAGLTASKQVKAAGRRVALIDPTPIGELCALKGCNSKKVLVRATEVLQLVNEAREHGIDSGDVHVDWNAVIDRKHDFTDHVTESTQQSLHDSGVEYIKSTVRFAAPDQLEADGRTLSFDGVIVATGSTPRRLSFPGAHYLSSTDQILEARTVPACLAIIGAGVVAFEFAQVFARLGASVHILMRGHQALKGHEHDLVAQLVKHLGELVGWVERSDTHHSIPTQSISCNPGPTQLFPAGFGGCYANLHPFRMRDGRLEEMDLTERFVLEIMGRQTAEEALVWGG